MERPRYLPNDVQVYGADNRKVYAPGRGTENDACGNHIVSSSNSRIDFAGLEALLVPKYVRRPAPAQILASLPIRIRLRRSVVDCKKQRPRLRIAHH